MIESGMKDAEKSGQLASSGRGIPIALRATKAGGRSVGLSAVNAGATCISIQFGHVSTGAPLSPESQHR